MDDSDKEFGDLLNMAAEFDRGVDVDAKVAATAAPATSPKPEAPKVDDPPKDAAPTPDKETKPDDGSLKPADKAATEQPPKSKWAAEQERKAKTWKQLNDEREALKAEQEALKREREEWQRKHEESKQKQAATERYKDEHGFTAQDYRDYAKRVAESDKDVAARANAKADELDKKEQEVRAKAAQDEFGRQWAAKYESLAKDNPTLKDPKSEDYQAVLGLLNKFPLLTRDPNGLEYAWEAVRLNRTAAQVAAKEAKIKELSQEVETLRKKTAIGSGVPTTPPSSDKPFEEMSVKEQEAHLKQTIRNMDREAGFGS